MERYLRAKQVDEIENCEGKVMVGNYRDGYISKKDVCEVLVNAAKRYPSSYEWGLGDARKEISRMKCADVSPVVHSKWTLNKDGSGTCQNCGFTQVCCWDVDNWDNFCHHCGADMREVFEEKDVVEMERTKKAERARGWIPVREELPFAEYGESDSVLCATEMGVMKVLYFDGGVWCWPSGETYQGPKVKFWRELPSYPTDDTGSTQTDYIQATMEVVDSQPYFKKHYRKLCCSNCKREVLKSWSFCPDCGVKFMKEKKP